MKGRTRHIHKCLTRRQVDARITQRIAACSGIQEANAMLGKLRQQAIRLLDTGGVVVVVPSEDNKVRTVYRLDSYRRKARFK